MSDYPKNYYKYLNFIFAGMLLGPLIFLGISAFLIITGGRGVLELEIHIVRLLEYLLLGSIAFFIPVAIIRHKRILSKIDRQQELQEKLKVYSVSFVAKLALVELVCFFNIFILLFSGEYILAFPVILLLLYIVQNRPSVQKIAQELGLSTQEREQLAG